MFCLIVGCRGKKQCLEAAKVKLLHSSLADVISLFYLFHALSQHVDRDMNHLVAKSFLLKHLFC